MIDPATRWHPPNQKSGLLVKNRWLHGLLFYTEKLLPKCGRGNTRISSHPQRILIGLGGNLGDALISMYAVRELKDLNSSVKIDIVAPIGMKPVLDLFPSFGEMYWTDPWPFNRAKISFSKKLFHDLHSQLGSILKLRRQKYDLAIDFYYFWPNNAVTFYLAGICDRMGYTSGGFGRLFTHPVPWVNERKHVVQFALALIERAFPSSQISREPLWSKDDFGTALAELRARHKLNSRYVVIHPGAGKAFKEWPVEKWVTLIREIRGQGFLVALGGQGKPESEICLQLSQMESGVSNLCNLLSLSKYLAILSGATFYVGVDSLGGHLATAVGTATVVIYPGITWSEQWKPWGNSVETLTHQMPCAPCYLSSGCLEMECLREVEVADVNSVLGKILSRLGVAVSKKDPRPKEEL